VVERLHDRSGATCGFQRSGDELKVLHCVGDALLFLLNAGLATGGENRVTATYGYIAKGLQGAEHNVI
jgi:hypothetical protein